MSRTENFQKSSKLLLTISYDCQHLCLLQMTLKPEQWISTGICRESDFAQFLASLKYYIMNTFLRRYTQRNTPDGVNNQAIWTNKHSEIRKRNVVKIWMLRINEIWIGFPNLIQNAFLGDSYPFCVIVYQTQIKPAHLHFQISKIHWTALQTKTIVKK